MSASDAKRPVAVLGLGNMGSALVDRLLGQGHQVTAWNRSPERCQSAEAAGALIAATPADAARVSDATLEPLTARQRAQFLDLLKRLG